MKQAVKDFKKAWNKGNNEFYIISTAFYQLASLTNEPEIKVIEHKLNVLERKYQSFNQLSRVKKYVVSHIKLYLCIMIMTFLVMEVITGRIGDNRNDGFLALIALLMFAGVIGTIALVFHTWNAESRLKSSNLPEKKAITKAIDSLIKKTEGITDDKK